MLCLLCFMKTPPKSAPVLSLQFSWKHPQNRPLYCHYMRFWLLYFELCVSWKHSRNRLQYCHYSFHENTPELHSRTVIKWDSDCCIFIYVFHENTPEFESSTVITVFMKTSPKSTSVLSLNGLITKIIMYRCRITFLWCRIWVIILGWFRSYSSVTDI